MKKFNKMYWVAMAISLLAGPVVVQAAADPGGTEQVQAEPVGTDQVLMRSLMKADQRKAAAARAKAAREAKAAATNDTTSTAKEKK